MKEKLIKMLAEYRNIPENEVETDVPFSKMGLDSLDMAEFVMKDMVVRHAGQIC